MRVTYVGPLPGVVVPELRERVVARGVEIEVPDDLGAALCQQRVWRATVELVGEELEEAPNDEWTVAGLRQRAAEWGVEIPSSARKAEIVAALDAEAARRARNEAPAIEPSE